MSLEIERTLKSALGRLKSGNPEHPDVKALLLAGKSIITGVCLAKESGHHRSLFQHAGCSYPLIYAQLQAARASSVPGRLSSRLRSLEKQVKALSDDNAVLRTINASLVVEVAALRDAEEKRESSRFRRIDKRKGSR